ncbi:MAG: hypothetical protein MI922_18340, partial [Bacteroidales bacterium]|nr:hypothetical protein [Bacteroidales bacterium]
MKKHISLLITFACAVFLFSSHSGYLARSVVVGFGIIKHNNKKITGVSVKVYKDDQLIRNQVTGRTGSYGFTLKFGIEYRIVLAKEGYLKQTIFINTTAPKDAMDYSDEFFWEPDFTMYKYIQGLNNDEITLPVARYVFDEEYFGFSEDKSYMQEIKPIIDNLQEEILELEQKLYESLITKAD